MQDGRPACGLLLCMTKWNCSELLPGALIPSIGAVELSESPKKKLFKPHDAEWPAQRRLTRR